MKKAVDKGISAAGAILFVGLIQTDAPTWSLVVLTLVMYEIAQWCCRIARREARRQRRNRYITASRTDAQRWAEQWFNPYKGVRA
jgi:ABC-type dipeptide/oligopeptide/nickel transport system permease subunit